MSSHRNMPGWLKDLLRSFGLLPECVEDDSVASRRFRDGEGRPGARDSAITTYDAAGSDDVVGEGEDAERPLVKIKAIDLLVAENTKEHHTEKYEVTQKEMDGEPNTPRLIVRRGQPFHIDLTLTQEWTDVKDKLTIVFDIGDNPLVSKGTRVQLEVKNKGVKGDAWGAEVVESNKNKVRVRVYTPPDAFVGELTVHVDTSRPAAGRQVPETVRYSHPDFIVLLFNPWCKQDSVHLEDDLCRQEYVLNDVGKIYSGNFDCMEAKPWNFGQFESVVLDCALYLLNRGDQQVCQRRNPVPVVRTISALVNAPDDNGVLVGSWPKDGKYDGGINPLAWAGSVEILEQYMEKKQPVRYGQCWVFSGLVTSVCRALGIPCRSVTNFESAHDHDNSITIDCHLNTDREPHGGYRNDSTWNFHVWNDVWMARPDLPPGYGGWQAVDATPQERSHGVYRTGPASLVAVKKGDVSLQYDAPFVFAEVNGDMVTWEVDAVGNFKKLSVDRFHVGRNISTKKPTGRPPNKRLGPFAAHYWDDEDRLDVTSEYKFVENTEEERAAAKHACSALSVKCHAVDAHEVTCPQDVEFEITHQKEGDEIGVMIGQPVTIVCRMRNTKPKEVRHVHTNLTVHVVSYTGIRVAQIKKKKEERELNGEGEFEEVKVELSPEDYLEMIVDQGLLQISAMCRVEETGQVYVGNSNFRFIHPDVDVQIPLEVLVNSPFKASMKIKNPLPRMLTSCKLHMEGPGLQKPLIVPLANIPAGEEVEKAITLTARRPGERQLIVSFVSKQLTEVTGFASTVVKLAEEE